MFKKKKKNFNHPDIQSSKILKLNLSEHRERRDFSQDVLRLVSPSLLALVVGMNFPVNAPLSTGFRSYNDPISTAPYHHELDLPCIHGQLYIELHIYTASISLLILGNIISHL